MMMKGYSDMSPITDSQRVFTTTVAGYEPPDEEIREFITEYEDWLYSVENTSVEESE